MVQPVLYLPTPEYVATALLSDLLPVPAATRLPKPGTWPIYAGTIQGFATVSIVGGFAGQTLLRRSVVSVGTWTNIPGSDEPQWGAASQLAEIVVDASRRPFVQRTYRQSAKYVSATVNSLWFISEPRRIPDPDASMAHFETEVGVSWRPNA
jgi:hypothetical protein